MISKPYILILFFDGFGYVTLNRGPKKQKMEPNIQKKSFLDPPKHQFYFGKTMGYGKTLSSTKKQNCFLVRFLRGVGYPETLFLTRLFNISGIKKSALLASMLAPYWTVPIPKPGILKGF